jgi:hypothetical protein
MKLSPLLYNSAAGFCWFSMIVSNALTVIQQTKGINFPNPTKYSLPHFMPNTDMFNCDPGGIWYGRYLSYTKAPGKAYPFWIGLYIQPDQIRFVIWFDTDDTAIQSIMPKLQTAFPEPQHTLYQKTHNAVGSLCIWMNSIDNDSLLDGNHSQKYCEQLVHTFWDSVLSAI